MRRDRDSSRRSEPSRGQGQNIPNTVYLFLSLRWKSLPVILQQTRNSLLHCEDTHTNAETPSSVKIKARIQREKHARHVSPRSQESNYKGQGTGVCRYARDRIHAIAPFKYLLKWYKCGVQCWLRMTAPNIPLPPKREHPGFLLTKCVIWDMCCAFNHGFTLYFNAVVYWRLRHTRVVTKTMMVPYTVYMILL